MDPREMMKRIRWETNSSGNEWYISLIGKQPKGETDEGGTDKSGNRGGVRRMRVERRKREIRRPNGGRLFSTHGSHHEYI